MFKRNLTSLAVGAMLAMGAASTYALVPSFAGDTAREAAEGPRGADNERPGDRQRRGARNLIDTQSADTVAAKGSGRDKPRVPGGSGCDDPEDLIEHPECAGNAPLIDTLAAKGSGRDKPRVPGGSGCDDPEDVIEHPECRLGAATQDKQFVAREASEGPRGADNERPGDRQRRGGRGRG